VLVDALLDFVPGRVKRNSRFGLFVLVLKSRFPSVHDKRTRSWGKALGRLAAHRRWTREEYDDPRLLRAIRQLARIVPDDTQLYGHLRPANG
jgi:hypothetical protein